MEGHVGVCLEQHAAALNFASDQTTANHILLQAESQEPPFPATSSSGHPETNAQSHVPSRVPEDNYDEYPSSSETTTSSESDSDESDPAPDNALDSEDDVPPDVLRFGIRSKHEVQVHSFLISCFFGFSVSSACLCYSLFSFRNTS
jgi:hypothetical protein